MRIGRFELRPGGIILILLVMAGLVYAGLKQLGLLDGLTAKLNPDTGSKGSVILDSREKLENISLANLPASSVKAPEKTSDNPDVTIGIWTWQTVSGLIDAVGGPG